MKPETQKLLADGGLTVGGLAITAAAIAYASARLRRGRKHRVRALAALPAPTQIIPLGAAGYTNEEAVAIANDFCNKSAETWESAFEALGPALATSISACDILRTTRSSAWLGGTDGLEAKSRDARVTLEKRERRPHPDGEVHLSELVTYCKNKIGEVDTFLKSARPICSIQFE